jgi:hypothetical protein
MKMNKIINDNTQNKTIFITIFIIFIYYIFYIFLLFLFLLLSIFCQKDESLKHWQQYFPHYNWNIKATKMNKIINEIISDNTQNKTIFYYTSNTTIKQY